MPQPKQPIVPAVPIGPSAGFHLEVTPEKAALVQNKSTRVRVLLRVQAPQPPAGAVVRNPLHLALVLDRSGSMVGPPLDEAKRCARNIIDSLAPGDRAAIFAFDDEVQCVAPLTPAANKLALAAALATIDAGGSTNLHGGWRAGADELEGKLLGKDVHRVILLSDGRANAGEVELEQIAQQCKTLAQAGVSTSTYGLGNDFNEALMLAMASAGRGNGYYGQTAADLAEPFAAEFALLSSLCARGLVLKVNAPQGMNVTLRNDFVPVEGELHTWSLPDLAFASEAWAVLEFDILLSGSSVIHTLELPFTMSIQAATTDSTPLFLMAALPSLLVVTEAAYKALPVDPLVTSRLLELDAADALDAVRKAIEAGDWKLAQKLVTAAKRRFKKHEWAAAIIATMTRLVEARDYHLSLKEARYSSASLRMRLACIDEMELKLSDEVPEFLMRKAEQGKGRQP